MFRQDKATQLAVKFLKLRDGRLEYIHLLKMMYMSDKSMLLKRGSPITYDKLASLDKGPILSATYNLIKGTFNGDSNYWNEFIGTDGIFSVMKSDPGDGALSRSEDAAAERVFQDVGNKDRWELVELTHTFPEWTFPNGSSLVIHPKDVLVKNGKSNLIDALNEM